MRRGAAPACILAGLAALAWGACASLAAAADPPPPAQQMLVLVKLPTPHYRPGAAYSGDGYAEGPSRQAQRRIADRIAHDHGLSLIDDWPMPLIGLDCFVMAAPGGPKDADQAAAALAHDPAVAWTEPMHLYHAQGQPAAGAARRSTPAGDPLYAAQPAAREWRLADLHKVATGRRVSVAVIDSQVEANHPDLAGQVALSENFTPQRAVGGEMHGTGVAGVIAAKENNGVGVVGVAPGARLFALRACWQEGRGPATVCDSVSLAKALHFAIERRAQVINLSLAGPPDMLLGRLVDAALSRGITVVAAYDQHLPGGGFPASHPGVLRVTDESLAALPAGVYSAPGRDVPTTEPGGRWSLVDGSSYAAAHVSGLAALLRERGATSGGKVALASSRPMGGPIDACASLLGAGPPCARKAVGVPILTDKSLASLQR